jgi:hypothetical protein
MLKISSIGYKLSDSVSLLPPPTAAMRLLPCTLAYRIHTAHDDLRKQELLVLLDLTGFIVFRLKNRIGLFAKLGRIENAGNALPDHIVVRIEGDLVDGRVGLPDGDEALRAVRS